MHAHTHTPTHMYVQVAKNGEICVNTLKKDWKADCKLSHILMVVRCLLIEPNPESALNEEAGRMFMEVCVVYFYASVAGLCKLDTTTRDKTTTTTTTTTKERRIVKIMRTTTNHNNTITNNNNNGHGQDYESYAQGARLMTSIHATPEPEAGSSTPAQSNTEATTTTTTDSALTSKESGAGDKKKMDKKRSLKRL